jgi:hypothetical protein
VDRGLISDKCKGLFAKWWGISAGHFFFNRKYHGGPGSRRVDWAARLGSTVDRGGADKGARTRGRGRSGSPVLNDNGGGGRAAMKWRRLELVARV